MPPLHYIVRPIRILTLTFAILIGLFTASSPEWVAAQTPTEPTTVISVDPWIEAAPHTLLMRVAPGVDLGGDVASAAAVATGDLADALRQAGVTGVKSLLPAGGPVTVAGGEPSRLARVYRLQLDSGADLAQARQTLAANPAVERVEYDYIARGVLAPNDPEYPSQWAAPKIGLPAAWDAGTGSGDVVIALVDSGLDLAHPDLAGRLWVNPGEIPGNGVDDDANGYVDDVNGWNFVAGNNNLVDPYGHGTQVAGVMAAVGNNGQGIAGVCWQCKLMVVTAMQNGGAANYSDIAAAVAYASSNGADIINLSLGGYADSAMLADAVREAAVTAVLVGGAGNDDSSAPFYPAAYPEVIGVAATDNADTKTVFSNYGPWVDVAAPGDAIRTTALGGGYGTDSGTSLATAYASGVAGLIASKHLDWSPDLVAWQLLNTSASIDGQNAAYVGKLGHGRLAADQAVAVNPQPAGEVAGFTVDGQAGGQPAPGATFGLVVNVRNLWLPGRGLNGALTTTSPHATITGGSGSFGDIDTGRTGSNTATPFQVTLAANTPYAAEIPFALNLTGTGGYALTLNFSVRVRSAVETLGNTSYTVDTTWTSDKTYVLNGAVIVASGATLTIQPGTVVKAAAEKFIRVDGTLIARGTTDQPIVFTANTSGGRWAGIRFTASAVNAVFNLDGSYQSGSIVQHVDLSNADVGLALNGRAPYIADSRFRGAPNNMGMPGMSGNAIDTGGSQTLRIERNTIENGTLTVGGGATVLQNTLIGTPGACGINLTGGSPLVMQNTLEGCAISGQGQFPAVISNTVRGGAVNLSLSTMNGGGHASLPPFLAGPRLTAVAAGGSHTCALTAAGSVLCWGNGGNGQLGDGTTTSRSKPVAVTGLDSGVAAIAAGGYHTCAVTTAGGVNCWGNNAFWQLGSVPVAVTGLSSGVAAIAAGGVHTCALTTAGGVLCWGANYAGQLGDGTNESRSAPVAVVGLNNGVAAVATRDSHTCALNTSGGVLCWGYNDQGQLGDGTTTSRGTPVAVTGLSNGVADVAAGGWHTCALTTAGGVLCWGYSGEGQLGNGSTSNHSAPVGVTGLDSGVAAVAAGVGHTCALTTVGGVKCWGYNGQGQLGDGTTESRSAPVAVVGLSSGVAAISTGGNHTCAVTTTGKVKCWGDNMGGGQLGDGTWMNSSTPVDLVFGEVHFQGNSIHGGSGASPIHYASVILYNIDGDVFITHNTIGQNTGPGLALSGLTRGDNLTIRDNNFIANATYDLQLEPGAAGTQNFTVDASGNYWNVPSNQVAGRIRDCTFDVNGCGTPSSTVGKVLFDPPLSAPDQVAPAFATSAKLTPDPVGLQQGTLGVDFSRPMRTDVLPTATFYDARRGTSEKMVDDVGYMAKDVTGRLWFSVQVEPFGVKMYDGSATMTHYTAANSPLGRQQPITAIFGASNGEVWFAQQCCGEGEPVLTRLQGSTWITYTHEAIGGDGNSINAIGEDAQGNLWFSSWGPVLFRFDGVQWSKHVPSVGSPGSVFSQIVRDSRGDLWFRADQGLVVFDGTNWRTVTETDGLPSNSIQALFADSQGRIWVGFGWTGDPDPRYVGMYDGSRWIYYGSRESNGLLTCGIDGFAEAPDGSIWMSQCGQVLVVDGDAWSVKTYNLGGYGPLLDNYGHLWYHSYNTARVLWSGLNHAFANPAWPSPTRFQATYDFSAAVPRGQYQVEIKGMLGNDGLPAQSPPANVFTVAYGGAVSNLPPLPPQVALSSNSDLTTLALSWPAQSGVDGYRYAIGTVVGGRDVLGWTYSTANSVTRTGLKFTPSKTYYVTVQARGTNGLWSTNSFSASFVAGTDTSAPPAPTVSVQNSTLTSVTISWNKPRDDVDQYRYCLGASAGACDIVNWTTAGQTTATANGLSLIADTTYYVTVQAHSTNGLWSTNNSSASFVADAGATSPPAPTVSILNNSPTSVTVSWNKPRDDVDQYRYCLGASTGACDVLDWTTTGQTTATANELSLIAGTTYYITVQAHSTNGLWSTNNSSASFVAGTGATSPPAPAVSLHNSNLTSVTISWNKPRDDVDQYRYCLGASSGICNIVDWTTTGQTTMTLNGLSLVAGTTYYVTVQAHSTNGLWSTNNTSASFVPGQVSDDGEAVFLPSLSR